MHQIIGLDGAPTHLALALVTRLGKTRMLCSRDIPYNFSEVFCRLSVLCESFHCTPKFSAQCHCAD